MEFLGFIPRFLMGLMLGYLFDWSKNIWVNIAAHALNNGISVIAYFMFVKGYTSTDIDNMDHYGIAPTAIAVVFFAVLFYLFYKNVNQQPIELSN
jgi:membrane protease YdiL (CAAX protease family)